MNFMLLSNEGNQLIYDMVFSCLSKPNVFRITIYSASATNRVERWEKGRCKKSNLGLRMHDYI